jgi:hypothetical protein
MAEVLAPIGSSSTMTIPYSQDAFQNPNPSGLTAARRQLPRNSVYNQPLPNMGYRGPSSVPISPYAFQTTPQLKQDVRPSPNSSSKPPAGNEYFRPPYQESSASSTSSTSTSSNRSHGSPFAVSKDDSVLGARQRQSFADNRVSHNMVASLSTPDLSMPSNEPSRPSPDRYRRISRNMDNVNSSNLPQSADSSPMLRPVSAPFLQRENPQPFSDGFNVKRASMGPRTGSYDDFNVGTNAARYKRRSGIGRVDSNSPIQPLPSPVQIAPPTWSQVVAGRHNFQGPLPPPQQLQRPSHMRSSSYGENKIPQASKPVPVSLTLKISCLHCPISDILCYLLESSQTRNSGTFFGYRGFNIESLIS